MDLFGRARLGLKLNKYCFFRDLVILHIIISIVPVQNPNTILLSLTFICDIVKKMINEKAKHLIKNS